MNPFRILREHLIASGLLFTDKQLAEAVSQSYKVIQDLREDLEEADEKLDRANDNCHNLHKEIKELRRHQRDFEREYRDFEEEYHNLVRYCLRLEKRLHNAEKLLVILTDQPTQEVKDDD